MKHFFHLALIVPALILTGCGGKKKSAPENNISNQYKLEPFNDINNPSTLNLETLKKDIPKIVNLKDKMSSAKDQGDRGMCSFFVATALVEAAIKIRMNVDVNLSEEYLNYAVKSQNYFPKSEGSLEDQNLAHLKKAELGFLQESDWPYQPSWFGSKAPCVDFDSTDKKAPAECFSHSAPSKEIIAKSISSKDFIIGVFKPVTTNELIEALAEYKQPMSIGVSVNHEGWNNNGTVEYTEKMREDCISNSAECGEHAVIITGYDLDKKVFFFRNSWGKKWGSEGYGTFPFDFIDRHAELYLTVVDLDKDLVLPNPLSAESYKLKTYAIKSNINVDSSVSVNSSAAIENAELYTVKQDTFLVKIPAARYYSPSEENVVKLKLVFKGTTYNIGNELYDFPTEKRTSLLSYDLEMKIPEDQMNERSVLDVKYSREDKLLLRTSLSIHTDEGYKVLKRYYHPLNYQPQK